MELLKGKIAMVTGGTRGIGYAIVKLYLENGASVAICGSRQETVDKALDKLKAENPEYADRDELFERIKGLPATVQNIIRLRFYEELSLQEIAEAMGLNLNTVKAKLYRGLKALRVEMEGMKV